MSWRARWLEEREAGRGLQAHLLPLDLLSLPYGTGAWLHRCFYASPLGRRKELPCRVVSVGGITVGGSGKTPLAAAVAVGLRARGHRVALVSRGYGRRRNPGVTPISDGRQIQGFDPASRGDEPLVLAAGAPGVPVVVGPDREQDGLRAIASYDTEIVVLDDGFQHHRLARDVDLVALHGEFGLGNGRVLPRGPLREPLGALACSDALVILDGALDARDAARVSRCAPQSSVFHARRQVQDIVSLRGGDSSDPASIVGEPVGLLCGIARPASFRRTIEALGARVVKERHFPNHHSYRPRDLTGLDTSARLWLTTEKDAVKILPSWGGSERIRVLRSRVELDDETRFFGWLESKLLSERSPV